MHSQPIPTNKTDGLCNSCGEVKQIHMRVCLVHLNGNLHYKPLEHVQAQFGHLSGVVSAFLNET